LESGFKRYLVLNKDDAGLKKLITRGLPRGIRVKFYSLRKRPKNLKLSIPGLHNLSNALGALEVAKIFHIKQKLAFEALKEFTGIWRRLEFKGRLNGAMIFDDYGHHPTEIKATCQAARELIKNGRLFLVFQPHQYYRVLTLFDKFLNAFDLADFLILTDIYSVPGRESEEIKKKISSKILLEELSKIRKNVYYIKHFADIEHFLKNNLKKGDICVIMGAGNIWQLTEKLIKDSLNKR
jgi:UDP-N-acetylmuramate--alanine ligase